MSEREKNILEQLGKSLGKMGEFEKGYILGIAESKRETSNRRKKEVDDTDAKAER